MLVKSAQIEEGKESSLEYVCPYSIVGWSNFGEQCF